jgi:hypothetical protein
MHTPTLPGREPQSVKPVSGRPVADVCEVPLSVDDPLPLETRLKFVQVGVWEIRRRWLAGQTFGLDELLAHLDEDLDRLCRVVEPDAN